MTKGSTLGFDDETMMNEEKIGNATRRIHAKQWQKCALYEYKASFKRYGKTRNKNLF